MSYRVTRSRKNHCEEDPLSLKQENCNNTRIEEIFSLKIEPEETATNNEFDESSYGATDLLAVQSVEDVTMVHGEPISKVKQKPKIEVAKLVKQVNRLKKHKGKKVIEKLKRQQKLEIAALSRKTARFPRINLINNIPEPIDLTEEIVPGGDNDFYDFHLAYLKEYRYGVKRVCLEELVRLEHSYSHSGYLSKLKFRGYVECKSCRDIEGVSHSLQKIFRCMKCGKRFKSEGGLFQHTRKHVGVNKASCSLCKQNFRYNTNLKIHYIKWHYSWFEKNFSKK